MKVVNLANRPFVNSRPLLRLAVLLWSLGLVLLLVNVWLYRSYWVDSAEIRSHLAEVDGKIQQELQHLAALDGELAGLDLDEQNDHIAFLNRLIGNRTFPWSRLFERLEEILPWNVWLTSVQPDIQQTGSSGARRTRSGRSRTPRRGTKAAASEEVILKLQGAARSDEALLEMVDEFYSDPYFSRPVLSGDNLDPASGNLHFSLDVYYRVGQEVPTENDVQIVEGGEAEGPVDASGEDASVMALEDSEGAVSSSGEVIVQETAPDSTQTRRDLEVGEGTLEQPGSTTGGEDTPVFSDRIRSSRARAEASRSLRSRSSSRRGETEDSRETGRRPSRRTAPGSTSIPGIPGVLGPGVVPPDGEPEPPRGPTPSASDSPLFQRGALSVVPDETWRVS